MSIRSFTVVCRCYAHIARSTPFLRSFHTLRAAFDLHTRYLENEAHQQLFRRVPNATSLHVWYDLLGGACRCRVCAVRRTDARDRSERIRVESIRVGADGHRDWLPAVRRDRDRHVGVGDVRLGVQQFLVEPRRLHPHGCVLVRFVEQRQHWRRIDRRRNRIRDRHDGQQQERFGG
jgi:hypothetical protein